MNNSETNNTNVSLSFKVLINGNSLAEMADIISISVRKQFHKIATAEVVMYYGSMLNVEFVDDDNDDIAVGSEIEIHTDEEEDTCIFKGIVVKKSVSLTSQKSLLSLTAKHKADKMTRNRSNHVFSEKKDSDIIEELIKKHGLACEIDSTSYQNETVTQYNCSDWDFINIKAELNSLLVFTDNDEVTVKKPKMEKAKLEINGYDNVIEFDAQLDGRTSFSDYKAVAWNYNSQEKQEVEQSNNADPFKQGIQQSKDIADKLENKSCDIHINSYFIDNDLMSEKINSSILRNNLSRIIGKVKIYGVGNIKPGETITFSGIGESFNGDAFVTEVDFDFIGGAWTTSIGFGMEETPYYWSYDDINGAPAAGINSAVNGLQIGKVEALEGDPNDDFRIKVSLPCFSGDNTEIWARMSLPDAGNNRGYFFFPEIDDEVVVGFIDQNPNNPVVLGVLHSNKFPAAQSLSDDNNLKGIYLKSGIKLEIDEEDKIVNLETPGSNKLILNDKDGKIEIVDANGNQIVMDNQGITIKSAGKIAVEATSDMNLKGVNLTAEASASLKATGSANAEISSSGVMVVKGSLTQIN